MPSLTFLEKKGQFSRTRGLAINDKKPALS